MAFSKSAGESYYDSCKENAFIVRHGGHPDPSASIDSVLKKPTPGHKFSCSLPSFPILLLFNKAGHCSDHLWLPLSAAVWIWLQADRETNSCSQTAAEGSVTKVERKIKKKKVLCSGTETQVGENHSPLAFTLYSEGCQRHISSVTRT